MKNNCTSPHNFDIMSCPAHPACDTRMSYEACHARQLIVKKQLDAGFSFTTIDISNPDACIGCSIGKQTCKALKIESPFTGLHGRGFEREKREKRHKGQCAWPGCQRERNDHGLCRMHSLRRWRNTFIKLPTKELPSEEFKIFMDRYFGVLAHSGATTPMELNMALFCEGLKRYEERT